MAAVVASTPLMGTTSCTTGRSCRSLPLLPAAADDGEKEVGREGRTRAKPTRSSKASWITSGERDFLVLVVGLVACFEFHICERVLLFLVDSEMYAIQIGGSRCCISCSFVAN